MPPRSEGCCRGWLLALCVAVVLGATLAAACLLPVSATVGPDGISVGPAEDAEDAEDEAAR